MTDMEEELVVLCDEDGNPTGVSEKLSTHHAKTPRHLAFSCYVFNDEGELLVTQRAHGKKVWPNVWTNTVCGHPAPGEATLDALKRRLQYELGMEAKDFEVVLLTYKYTTPPYNGIIENEFCPVYVAHVATKPKPNSTEVDGIQWLAWDEFAQQALTDTNDVWSWWCKDQIKQLEDLPILREYSQQA